MSLIFNIILVVIIALYILVIGGFSIGWYKQNEKFENNKSKDENSFSIIIPFKNEELYLKLLLEDLTQLNYSNQLYEIILIDDSSIDNSSKIVKNFIHENKLDWKIIPSVGGKKSALEKGIKEAFGKYIITFDADCRIPSGILKAYNQQLQEKSSKMIAGPVTFYSNNSFWGQILELEFISLIGSGAGSVNIKMPIMLNAANLLFERELAIEAKSDVYHTETSSGDDIFLMHYLVKKYGAREIHFLKNKAAIVRTEAPKNIKEWTKQRIRWTAKSRNYNINFTSITAAIILSFNILFLISYFFIFNAEYANLIFYIFIIKTLIDFPLIYATAKFLGQKNRVILMPILQISYPFYIIIIGFAGLLSKEGWRE